MHDENILYKIDGGRIEFRIGDMGDACVYDENYDCKNKNLSVSPYGDIEKIFEYIYRDYGEKSKAKTGRERRKRRKHTIELKSLRK